jgi:hypothetical protein
MERAKDGLSQYLDFISVIADMPEMRPLLIEWEATYELITLLNTLEAGVERKPLVEPRATRSGATVAAASSSTDAAVSDDDHEHHSEPSGLSAPQAYDQNGPTAAPIAAAQTVSNTQDAAAPGLPPLHDAPHKFPWSGIKVQILIILTSLVAPSSGRSGPGNPEVQKQILKYSGVMALLNCCVYDGYNEYLKERATLCLKWVMEGCDEAQQFVRELSPLKNETSHQNIKSQLNSEQAQGQNQNGRTIASAAAGVDGLSLS